MYTRLLLLLLIFFIPTQLCVQRNISGLITGGDSKERLPFADIRIKGTDKGTSSNVDGYFEVVRK